MAYTFDQIFAADPSNLDLIAANSEVLIFAPDDPLKTPVQLLTPDGLALPNPLLTNAHGFGPAFMTAELDRVAWEGGGLGGFLTSYEGMKNEAVAARDAADLAASNAGAAAASELLERIAAGEFNGRDGSNVVPTSEAIAAELETEGTRARAALDAEVAEVIAAQGTGPLDGLTDVETAGVVSGQVLGYDEAASLWGPLTLPAAPELPADLVNYRGDWSEYPAGIEQVTFAGGIPEGWTQYSGSHIAVVEDHPDPVDGTTSALVIKDGAGVRFWVDWKGTDPIAVRYDNQAGSTWDRLLIEVDGTIKFDGLGLPRGWQTATAPVPEGRHQITLRFLGDHIAETEPIRALVGSVTLWETDLSDPYVMGDLVRYGGDAYLLTGSNGAEIPGTGTEWQRLGDASKTLGELADVSTTGALAGNVLTFNGTAWTPAAPAAGDGTGTGAAPVTVQHELVSFFAASTVSGNAAPMKGAWFIATAEATLTEAFFKLDADAGKTYRARLYRVLHSGSNLVIKELIGSAEVASPGAVSAATVSFPGLSWNISGGFRYALLIAATDSTPIKSYFYSTTAYHSASAVAQLHNAATGARHDTSIDPALESQLAGLSDPYACGFRAVTR